MMLVRVTHIDGKLPNLALMRVARHHRDRGDTVVFSRRVERDMLEPDYDAVYGSAIFSYSAGRVAIMRENFPKALIGGTWNTADNTTVESVLGLDGPELFDYSIYPTFTASIGFTQRGCRLKCGFCVVPKKEGRPRAVNTIADLYRKLADHPKARGNNHVRAKIRQELQRGPFNRVSRGQWALAV
jgi:hypothetical protein